MKKLMVDGVSFEAEKIVKLERSIVGITSNKEVFRFDGINDFSIFLMDETYDPPDYSIIEVLAQRLTETEISNIRLAQLYIDLELRVLRNELQLNSKEDSKNV